MAQWPTDPSWIDPTTINDGEQYNAADGVKAVDLDTIIKDLIYLKLHGTATPTGVLAISANGTYEVSTYAQVSVNVPQPTGTKFITTNGVHDVAAYAQANVNVPQQQVIQRGIPMGVIVSDTSPSINPIFPMNIMAGYPITVTATGATYTGILIAQPEGITRITFTPTSEAYELPDDITVTGADYYWDSNTGVATIVDPTGPVTITCTCTQIQRNVTINFYNNYGNFYESGRFMYFQIRNAAGTETIVDLNDASWTYTRIKTVQLKTGVVYRVYAVDSIGYLYKNLVFNSTNLSWGSSAPTLFDTALGSTYQISFDNCTSDGGDHTQGHYFYFKLI